MTVLVGNGPSVMSRKCGGMIDSCTCVVRFNLYVLRKDLFDWTGSRTDVWAVNKGYCDGEFQDPVPRPPETLIAVPWADGAEGPVWTRCAKFRSKTVHIVPAAIAKQLTKRFGLAKWPSTGIVALAHYAALGKVALIGFDNFKAARHHYADDRTFCGRHSAQAEAIYVNELVDEGRVVLM